jgi:Rieske Fe-S protein
VPVARASAVGKKPLRVEIVVPEQRDAWAKLTDVRLGAAWLVRDAKDEIRAFSATCPHLGCAVDFDPDKGQFRCPCHTSAFDTEGNRLAGPAKRGMDPLDTHVDEKGRVLVRFQRYRQDSQGREPV